MMTYHVSQGYRGQGIVGGVVLGQRLKMREIVPIHDERCEQAYRRYRVRRE